MAFNIFYYLKNKNNNPSNPPYNPATPSEKEEIIGVHNNPIQCKLALSFVKELTKYKMLNVNDFDPSKHRYRDIAYLKDEIVKRSFNVDKK